MLEGAGIDVTFFFSAHSTRSVSTSAAISRDVTLSCISNAAGWSNERTLSKFCHKPIEKPTSMAQSVLDSFVNNDVAWTYFLLLLTVQFMCCMNI